MRGTDLDLQLEVLSLTDRYGLGRMRSLCEMEVIKIVDVRNVLQCLFALYPRVSDTNTESTPQARSVEQATKIDSIEAKSLSPGRAGDAGINVFLEEHSENDSKSRNIPLHEHVLYRDLWNYCIRFTVQHFKGIRATPQFVILRHYPDLMFEIMMALQT